MKLLKIFILFFLLFYTIDSISQKKSEFGFITDNDLYVSFVLDQYYTNGLEIYYKKTKPIKLGLFNKKISHFRVGQKMYNPFYSDIKSVLNQDRPYAGYLYSKYTEQFMNDKHILELGIEVGLTGKKTGAEWAQNFIHKFYNIPKSEGWKTQVKQKLSLGIYANYTRSLFYKPEKKVQLSWINNSSINSIFMNLSSGFAIKYNHSKNKTASIANTTFFGTALQTKEENWIKECYWGLKSYTTYQIKDETVTGELYNNPSQKQFHTQPWVWYNDIGYYWNLKKWNISYHQIFHTTNTKEITKKWIKYGSIELSYKF